MLIDNGAKIDECDKKGNFPLYIAVDLEDEKAVKALVENKADVHRKVPGGRNLSLCDLAIKKGATRILAMLNKNPEFIKNEVNKASPLENLEKNEGASAISTFPFFPPLAKNNDAKTSQSDTNNNSTSRASRLAIVFSNPK